MCLLGLVHASLALPGSPALATAQYPSGLKQRSSSWPVASACRLSLSKQVDATHKVPEMHWSRPLTINLALRGGKHDGDDSVEDEFSTHNSGARSAHLLRSELLKGI